MVLQPIEDFMLQAQISRNVQPKSRHMLLSFLMRKGVKIVLNKCTNEAKLYLNL